MLLFLFTCCLSFLFFYKSLAFKPLPPWAHGMRLLSLCFWKDFSFLWLIKLVKSAIFGVISSLLASRMSPRKKSSSSKAESVEVAYEMSVLDLPDLVLETILEKLPPEGLCRMATVCVSLREKCISDHLWKKHMQNKWSKIVGPAAYKEWQWYVATGQGLVCSNQGKQNSLAGYLTHLWPIVLIRSSFSSGTKKRNFPQVDSLMSWYTALESGKFWFPAQVYNREVWMLVDFLFNAFGGEMMKIANEVYVWG